MDDFGKERRGLFSHPGFQVGLIGGILLMAINLLLFLLNRGDTLADGLVWIFQVIAYFFLARAAAHRQAELRMRTYEPTRGITGAAVGAALTTSIFMWLYIIVRALVRDALGMFIIVEPLSLCFWIFIDVVIALVIGNAVGRSVEKHYGATPYDHF